MFRIGVLFWAINVLSLTMVLGQKGDYQLVAEFSPPHLDNLRTGNDRRFQLNSLKLSDSGKLLLAEYGFKSSLVAIYSLDSLKLIGAYWIDDVIELSQAYFSSDEKLLYIRAGRFASEYKIIDILGRTTRQVLCDKTPRGCIRAEHGLNITRLYTNDREFFASRNEVDKRTLHIYRLKRN